MPVNRHFLDWAEPVTRAIGRFLVPAGARGAIDFSDTLIVAPTRQAGRRLRQALAVHCDELGAVLLSAHVVTPAFFLHKDDPARRIASPLAAKAIWAGLLQSADLSKLKGLFPVDPPERSFAWALGIGELIESLRAALADGGHTASSVLKTAGDALEEPARWEDLAKLEAQYLDRLKALKLDDSCARKLAVARDPELPDGVKRIVLAAVPDPSLLALKAIERLSSRVPVDILVYAPAAMADSFDPWGRPVPDVWRDAQIVIPDEARNLLVCSNPSAQSRRVLEVIAEEPKRFGPDDLAVGVPDGSVIPFLAADLERAGLPAYDPGGTPVRMTSIYRLLDALARVVAGGGYHDFSAFLRHPDVLAYLEAERGLAPCKLLTQLDTFQNELLPPTAAWVVQYFHDKADAAMEYPGLAVAVSFVRDRIGDFENRRPTGALRDFLRGIYAKKKVGRHQDETFILAGEALDKAIHELEDCLGSGIAMKNSESLALLLRGYGTETISPNREGARVDLEGWLELPWNDAMLLVVSGMNEGIVPEDASSDPFLPDSLRRQLGLRDDAARFARDAYLMRSLIEWRQGAGGRVVFALGREGNDGSPLKPSRLLFRCADDELAERAARLFRPPEIEAQYVARTVTFRLDPGPPPYLAGEKLLPKRMAVTWFRDYLACPFRFYLKRILGMEELSDTARSLDQLAFGTLIHSAMQELGRNEEMRRCTDEDVLSGYLWDVVRKEMHERYGRSPPLAIAMQMEGARGRLYAAAHHHVLRVKEGWDIVETEKRVEAVIGGMTVVGMIDCIERNRNTGKVRILDYKTSDSAKSPVAAHTGPLRDDSRDYATALIGGKQRRWVDLQLPLYVTLLQSSGGASGELPDIGYFNLPRSAADAGVQLWDEFIADILKAAEKCARGVVADVLARRFWPPSERIEYDDFESLMPAPAEECFDGEAFTRRLGG